jgi:hypothetical protein
VWVLDTETKGTGANMVPLERVLTRGRKSVPGFRLPKRRRAAEPDGPPPPRQFRVINVMTRQVLGNKTNAKATIRLLEDVRSVVDVSVQVWDPGRGRWRMLTFGEVKTLWDHAHPGPAAATEPAEGPR